MISDQTDAGVNMLYVNNCTHTYIHSIYSEQHYEFKELLSEYREMTRNNKDNIRKRFLAYI